MMENVPLPWESPPHAPPRAVGICLSGGGLRAAAHGLGVLQALQTERRLLWGEKAADLLAVVSGGSYIGASLVATASRLGETAQPPLSEGTPEAEYVASHGRYLIEDGGLRFGWRILWRAILNVAVMLVFLSWVALMVAIYDTFASKTIHVPAAGTLVIGALLTGLTLLALARIARGLIRAGGFLRYAEPLLFFSVLTVCLPSFFGFVDRIGSLDIADWPTSWLTWLAVIGLVVATMALALGAGAFARSRRGTLAGLLAGLGGTWLARAFGLVIFVIAASAFESIARNAFESSDPSFSSVVAVAVIFVALPADYVAQRVPLHRMYRSLLGRCFAVHRAAGAAALIVPPNSIALSSVGPPNAKGRRFPRILICATANVTSKNSAGKKSRFSSFVFSHDRCGIPGSPGASFSTLDLERGRTPAGVLGEEPLSSLMDAVACTGAAISPSMGHDSIAGGRPLLSIVNLRLGQWFPNPLSPRIRRAVEDSVGPTRFIKDRGLGYGLGQFVQDLFGLQPGDGKWIYISDGGHYDNLGLIALLRGRCREIWCVDSDADPSGTARTIKAVLEVARAELSIEWELDLNAFRSADGALGVTHVVGQIRYEDGTEASIIVIKLGFDPATSESLRLYQGVDRRFPCHPTYIQWFGRARFEAYRQLGYENAVRAARL